MLNLIRFLLSELATKFIYWRSPFYSPDRMTKLLLDRIKPQLWACMEKCSKGDRKIIFVDIQPPNIAWLSKECIKFNLPAGVSQVTLTPIKVDLFLDIYAETVGCSRQMMQPTEKAVNDLVDVADQANQIPVFVGWTYTDDFLVQVQSDRLVKLLPSAGFVSIDREVSSQSFSAHG